MVQDRAESGHYDRHNPVGFKDETWEAFERYPYLTDHVFRNGLACILGQAGTRLTDEQVNSMDDTVIAAKCFYYSQYVGLLSRLIIVHSIVFFFFLCVFFT